MTNNEQQSDYWNGDAGTRWVKFSDRLDAMLSPFAEQILDKANIQPHETILDIGCGAGALSLMAARSAKSVLGVDISRPLLELAKERGRSIASAVFQHGDAAVIKLDEKRDVVLSRFGVMFFSDPAKAFMNIAQQVGPSGRLVFACWQSPEHNAWVRAPLEAAKPFLKHPLPSPEPYAPGPFAFAERHYLEGILQAGGWADIEIESWTGDIRMPGDDAHSTSNFMMEMGPLSKLMKDQDLDEKRVQSALIEKLSDAANVDGTVDMQASVWIVKAGLG